MNRFLNTLYEHMDDERGFTFAELIVVLFIFGALASVILFRFTDFSSSVSRSNLAQEIALTIKEAQTDAISGRYVNQLNVGDRPSYGVFFSQASPDRFAYFVDYFNDERFRGNTSGEVPSTCDPNEECLDIVEITESDRIVALCAGHITSQNATCDEDSSFLVDTLDITFERPFPEATIMDEAGDIYGNAEIVVASPQGHTLSIIVWKTGQISVRNK